MNRRFGLYGFLGLMMLALLAPNSVWAQAGGSAVPFLLIAPDARADGMGESGGAIADDATAISWNPAGLAFQRGRDASLTHSSWLPQFNQSDLFYEYVAGKMYMPEIGGTIAGSITYLNLGEFVRTENDPTPLDTWKAYEFAVTAGYATQVFEDLGIGLNLRYIRSSLAPFEVQGQGREGVANTFSFDIATMWRPTSLVLPFIGDIEDRFRVGLNLSNLGPKVTYIDAAQADPLPTNLRFSLGVQILKSQYNNLTIAADFSRLLIRRYPEVKTYTDLDSLGNIVDSTQFTKIDPYVDDLPKALITTWDQDNVWKNFTIGGGFEYWYGSPRLIALRWGYFYEHPENGNRKFMTFGAGIRYSVFGFDFSYLSAVEENHPLGETLRFTLLVGEPE
ncbi:MAG: type IX secretion system outer membrane channel protein PorV [Ignavibacteriales bacterium]|nr:type IX secretion system outer membrane channel protein PorV [Ignavibacteriales bacterium]